MGGRKSCLHWTEMILSFLLYVSGSDLSEVVSIRSSLRLIPDLPLSWTSWSKLCSSKCELTLFSWEFFITVVSKLECASQSPGRLIEADCWVPHPRVCYLVGLKQGPKNLCFLISSQAMQLPVWVVRFENHCSVVFLAHYKLVWSCLCWKKIR